MTTDSIRRLPATLDKAGHSKSTHYQHIADGLWTRPVRIGARAVGWPDSEIAALIAARIAGQTDEQIRELVQRLHARRVIATKGAL